MPRPFIIIFAIYVITGACFAPILMELPVPAIFPYRWHLTLHILGAVFLVGNVFITAVWAWTAFRTSSWPILRWAMRIVTWCDVYFTAPGFLLLAANGMVLASAWGGIYSWRWLWISMALLGATALTAGVLIPTQIKLWKLSTEQLDGPNEEYEKLIQRWNNWGTPAAVVPLVVLVLMVLKPRWG